MCSPNPSGKGPTSQFLMSRARHTPWLASCWVVPPCQPAKLFRQAHHTLLPFSYHQDTSPALLFILPPSATPCGVGRPSPLMRVSVTSKVGLAHLSGVGCHTLAFAWYSGQGAPPSFTTGVNRWSQHGQKVTISEVHSSRTRGIVTEIDNTLVLKRNHDKFKRIQII